MVSDKKSICSHLNHCYAMCYFSLAIINFFLLWFLIVCYACELLSFFFFRFTKLLKFVNLWLLINLRSFHLLFLQICFSASNSFSFTFWDSSDINAKHVDIVSYVLISLWGSVHLKKKSVFFRFYNFYWTVLSHFHSVSEPVQCIFSISNIVFFSS